MTNLVGQQQSGHVVVGMDGSESSKEALRWAMRQANATGSSVEAIMAWELPTTYAFGATMPTAYDFAPNCQRALHEVVQEVVGEYPGVEVSVVVTEGDARQLLVAASRDADLLVVGSRGHGEVVGLLLGSVSEYCATHATCPVVVIRHGRDAAIRKAEPVVSSATRA